MSRILDPISSACFMIYCHYPHDLFLFPSLALRMQNNTGLPDVRFNFGYIEEKTLEDAWNSPVMQMARNSDTGCGACPRCSS
jgi:hypothetical protein